MDTLVDTHCHLDFIGSAAEQHTLWQRCRAAGLSALLVPGVSPSQWSRVVAAATDDGVFFALGLHPCYLNEADVPASAPVFESVRNPGHALTERAVNFIVKAAARRAGVNPAASVHWLRHAHASHAIDNGAPITLVSATLGHADLKTTSVYAHARLGESSGRYLRTK